MTGEERERERGGGKGGGCVLEVGRGGGGGGGVSKSNKAGNKTYCSFIIYTTSVTIYFQTSERTVKEHHGH